MLSRIAQARALLRATRFQQQREMQWLRLQSLYGQHVEDEAFNAVGDALTYRAISVLRQDAGVVDEATP